MEGLAASDPQLGFRLLRIVPGPFVGTLGSGLVALWFGFPEGARQPDVGYVYTYIEIHIYTCEREIYV